MKTMRRNVIAVMNAKGGVGKSTLVLALAETLTAAFGKTVLVIDSDSQASVSAMLMTPQRLHDLQSNSATIVDLVASHVLKDKPIDWRTVVATRVSDVDDAGGLALIPSDMQLTLLEREVSRDGRQDLLRRSIRSILEGVRQSYDYVLIDCPPGLSVLTETWLRDADWHLSPTKPDYVSICGLEVFRRFKAQDAQMGFAENVGVVVNLMDGSSQQDRDYDAWLRQQPDNRCFAQPILRSHNLQQAAVYSTTGRSYLAKYPGHVGQMVRALTAELVQRVEAGQRSEPAPGGARVHTLRAV